jgi:hypothetical protein
MLNKPLLKQGGVFCLALPHDEHPPTLLPQFPGHKLITFDIAREFARPELDIGAWSCA